MFYQQSISIELGPVPCDEACAQVGRDDYNERSRRECKVYIRQLQRIFGYPAPDVLMFVRRGFSHDFGTYHEVVAVVTAEGARVFDEARLPSEWDHIARAELIWLRLQQQWHETVQAQPTAIGEVPAIFLQREVPDFPDHPVAQWWAMGFAPMPAGPAVSFH